MKALSVNRKELLLMMAVGAIESPKGHNGCRSSEKSKAFWENDLICILFEEHVSLIYTPNLLPGVTSKGAVVDIATSPAKTQIV